MPRPGPRLLPPATPRLSFREFRPGDAAGVLRIFEDPYARRFFPDMGAPASGRAWVERQITWYERHGFGLWVLEAREDGRFVGDAGLTVQPVEGRDIIEVGYHLVAAERGRGCATEAARACLDLAFRKLGPDLVGSLVHPENHASRRVAERIHDARREVDRAGEPYLLYYTERRGWEGRAGE